MGAQGRVFQSPRIVTMVTSNFKIRSVFAPSVLTVTAVAAILAGVLSSPAAAQPANAGKAAPVAGPAPRLADGKVDFGGKGVWAPIWVLDWADKKYVVNAVDVPFK